MPSARPALYLPMPPSFAAFKLTLLGTTKLSSIDFTTASAIMSKMVWYTRTPALYSWKLSWRPLFASTHVSTNAFWKEKLPRLPILDQSLPRARPRPLDLPPRKHKPRSLPNMPLPSQNRSRTTRLLPWNWITNEFPSLRTRSDDEWSLGNFTAYASIVAMTSISSWGALQPRNPVTLVIANPALEPQRRLLLPNENSTTSLTPPMALLPRNQQMATSGSDLGALHGRDFVSAPNSAFSF